MEQGGATPPLNPPAQLTVLPSRESFFLRGLEEDYCHCISRYSQFRSTSARFRPPTLFNRAKSGRNRLSSSSYPLNHPFPYTITIVCRDKSHFRSTSGHFRSQTSSSRAASGRNRLSSSSYPYNSPFLYTIAIVCQDKAISGQLPVISGLRLRQIELQVVGIDSARRVTPNNTLTCPVAPIETKRHICVTDTDRNRHFWG